MPPKARYPCDEASATWQKGGRKKRGRKSQYEEPAFLKALARVRRVMEFRNAEVIKENLPEWLPFIERHYGAFSEGVRSKLLTISASTMKRYFKRARELGDRDCQRLGRALFCALKYQYAQLPFGMLLFPARWLPIL